MATLVLSTVGTALGGPVGSAIGALIGQSIDQELLAPVRRGPRVGDLAVQTSSYGTQVPRIYGTMRVAGSVVWATDLIEHEQTGGAKGQPDVSYSYTISLAVALSSRPIAGIKRIWADGKLLRGAAGDLKVGGTLRVYDGSEQQEVDPFIASIEGTENMPAYRGLAMAVFEGLELSSFGNRIPFLTFEVDGAGAEPTVGSILGDASGGAIAVNASQVVGGYASYGRTIKSAVEPLIEAFGILVFDDGQKLKSPTRVVPLAIGSCEFGNSADVGAVPRMKREQGAATAPSSFRLTFYDPARDYQGGEARASAADEASIETQRELPAAMTAGDAKSLAQRMLGRASTSRDKLTLRLPRGRIALDPGDTLQLPLSPAFWTIERVTVDGFVPIVELRPAAGGQVQVAADPGRIAPNADVIAGPPVIALFDLPVPPTAASSQPTILLAASLATSGWSVRPAEIRFAGQPISTQTARGKSVLGNAISVLGPGTSHIVDEVSSVDVELVDRDQWLVSCDQDALAGGGNLAVIGKELLQFASAIPLGEGRFRLSHFLRGRAGTEWAIGDHAAGENFCVLRPGTLQPVALPSFSIGAEIGATVTTSHASAVLTGESLRPLSPVNLSADVSESGALTLRWIRRSRAGLAWVDGVDAPLGEAREQYRVAIEGILGRMELVAENSELVVEADALATLGAGPTNVEVSQIGGFFASRPARLNFVLA